MMYCPILLLLIALHGSSAEFLPNGTWINPDYCGGGLRECPPFNQLDDGTKSYEIREYLSAKWMCIDFHSQIPQTSEEYYTQLDTIPRHWNYWILRNYTWGANSENLINAHNLPIRTHMFYKQNIQGMYLTIANDFRLCYYMLLEDPPTPDNPDIEIGIEPTLTYYVWEFNSLHFNASRFQSELEDFKIALANDGVTDFDPSFHITCDYGPYKNPNGHNEIWLRKL